MDSRLFFILNEVIQSIVEDIHPAVEGKTIFLPNDVDYAMPTSEKRFVGGYRSIRHFLSARKLLSVSIGRT